MPQNTAENIEVSIIIPCRNEEQFIWKCLDSIVNNDYPKGRLKVLVIDGMSTDSTRDVIGEFEDRYGLIGRDDVIILVKTT
ncbi:MAG: glycosyltransferase [Deltaproteobacteria bacterium]|nr:glycosyltransferase [Deltaproteobacteria bacterium]